MAKVSKKNVSKKRVLKSSETSETETNGTSVQKEDEGLAEIPVDNNNSSDVEHEGDDDGPDGERRRQKLLAAIGALGGQRKRKLGERSEASGNMSEFTITADGEGERMDLSELIGTVEKKQSLPAKTKKQLKNLEQSKKTVDCPLSKQETERIHRDVAFQKSATEVSRWQGIVKQNLRAEQLVFPLNRESGAPKAVERVAIGWKARTPLEQEIFASLSSNMQPINDPVLTPAEEASLSAMSLEETKIRRAELQKARALQSYYEAKARREKKIKSKKYHKVQNKFKRKEFLKRFDEMVKTDPASALIELNKIELARMQERMSLKHQNSGKWAKSKAIMAKYDMGARQAMQQQLGMNKELTQKLAPSMDMEEEDEEEPADPEQIPDFANDAETGPIYSNPWMRGRLLGQCKEREISAAVVGTEEPSEAVVNEMEDEIIELDETETDLEKNSPEVQGAEPVPSAIDENEAAADYSSDEEVEQQSESPGSVEVQEIPVQEAPAEDDQADSTTLLEEGLTRIKSFDDMAFLSLETEAVEKAEQPHSNPPAEGAPPPVTPKPGVKKRKRKRGIELKNVLTAEAKVIKVPLAPTVEDPENSDGKLEQKGLITEAFAGDDVVSDFLRDKRRQEDEGKPKVVDLTLPGWGEWGGSDIKPSRNKRRRFRGPCVVPPPRKDKHLPSVIISEKRNASISLHQVNSLPFPFQSHTQYESTVRAPMGRTWNTEKTVKKMIKPKVITRLGSIIEPMAQEELMKDKKLASSGKITNGKITVK